MKAYVGAAVAPVDSILHQNNCKTYRELYQKILHDSEAELKSQKMQYQSIQVQPIRNLLTQNDYEAKIAEKVVLCNTRALLELKSRCLYKSTKEMVAVTKDERNVERLVL